ncbi:MAG: hypothetical protein COV36_07150 [Alphaproteobacteria bacterium CG11_big_fil_rev_8_21_14_0_20_44_7]|nr:MAG: hypothetical protein COV36_07150 [Alphaproteobacteria bacterium CG11_big_fil_rev_8_21_14_0_20_44_7]
MKRGFTLLELSFVIVVIGLLVGAAVIADNLITNSRAVQVVRELQQYNLALGQFYRVHRFLPGDLPNATAMWGTVTGDCDYVAGTGTETCDGDGDGTVDFTGSTGWEHESFRMWEQLYFARFIETEYTGAPTTSCTAGIYCITPGETLPRTSYGRDTIFYFSYIQGYWSWTWRNHDTHAFMIGAPNNQQTAGYEGMWHGKALTPQQAYSMDLKLDDEDPYTGKITNMRNTGSSAYAPNCTVGTEGVDAVYDVETTSRECVLVIDAKIN